MLERFSPIPVSLIGLQLTQREFPEWIFGQGSIVVDLNTLQITNHMILLAFINIMPRNRNRNRNPDRSIFHRAYLTQPSPHLQLGLAETHD